MGYSLPMRWEHDKKQTKNLYSKEDSEDVEVLFMGFESEISGEEIEDVTDLEVELINVHEELEKYKKMYKKLKNHMMEIEEKNKYAERMIVDLKNHVL